MSAQPQVFLVECDASDAPRPWTAGLAARGDSIGLAWRAGETTEDALDELQLLLEHTGGISCAVKLEGDGPKAVGRALDKMIDFFGRVDAIVWFSESFADDAAGAVAQFPARVRPKLISGLGSKP